MLVCGGRDFADYDHVRETLDAFIDLGITELIHGGANGADALAARWAKEADVCTTVFNADWSIGRAAGPQRNQRMLDFGRPDVVVAFPGGRGTADMIRRAKAAGVPVMQSPRPS